MYFGANFGVCDSIQFTFAYLQAHYIKNFFEDKARILTDTAKNPWEILTNRLSERFVEFGQKVHIDRVWNDVQELNIICEQRAKVLSLTPFRIAESSTLQSNRANEQNMDSKSKLRESAQDDLVDQKLVGVPLSGLFFLKPFVSVFSVLRCFQLSAQSVFLLEIAANANDK